MAAPVRLLAFGDHVRRFSIELQCGANRLTGLDQIQHQALAHIQFPLVLCDVSLVMAFVEHPPYVRPQTECVGEHLKDDVPVARAKPLTT